MNDTKNASFRASIESGLSALVASGQLDPAITTHIDAVIRQMLKKEFEPLEWTAPMTSGIVQALGPAGKSTLALETMNATLRVAVRLLDDHVDGDLPPELSNGSLAPMMSVYLFASLLKSAMFALELDPVREAALARDLVRCGNQLASGQMLDSQTRRIEILDLDFVEAVVLGKTGFYYECFLRFAAHHAELSDEHIAGYGAAGRHIGVCMQIVNDIMDLLRPDGSRDIARGLASLPVQIFLRQHDEAGQRDWLERFRDPHSDLATKLIKSINGGRTPTILKRIFDTHRDAARRQLAGVDAPASVREAAETFLSRIENFWAPAHVLAAAKRRAFRGGRAFQSA